MLYVQLLYFLLHSSKLVHTIFILIASNVCGECQKAVLCFKLKPTIKYSMYNYKRSSQLLMKNNENSESVYTKFLQGLKRPTKLKQ